MLILNTFIILILQGSIHPTKAILPEGLVKDEKRGLVVSVEKLDINDVLHCVGWYHLPKIKFLTTGLPEENQISTC